MVLIGMKQSAKLTKLNSLHRRLLGIPANLTLTQGSPMIEILFIIAGGLAAAACALMGIYLAMDAVLYFSDKYLTNRENSNG